MILDTKQCNTYKVVNALGHFANFTVHYKNDDNNAKTVPVWRLPT